MYASSTICASIFDTTNNELVVIFNNGGQYKYPNVSLTDYTRLETAESNGSTFNTYIKKKYTNFEKLDKLDDNTLKTILNEVSELKGVEEKATSEAKTKLIVDIMHKSIGHYLKTGSLDLHNMEALKDRVTDYLAFSTPKTNNVEPEVVN